MVHKILGNVPESQLVFGVKARTLTSYLTFYDTLFVVTDCGDVDRNEWKDMKNLFCNLVDQAVQFDGNGPSVQYLNHSTSFTNSKDADAMKDDISSVHPRGLAKIGKKLSSILTEYDERCKKAASYNEDALLDVKPLNIIVITDGDFDEETSDILEEIVPGLLQVSGYKSLDGVERRIGIQFVQVGNEEEAAESVRSLVTQHENDNLPIIDTVQYTGTLDTDLLYRIFLGAINNDVWQSTHAQSTAVPNNCPVRATLEFAPPAAGKDAIKSIITAFNASNSWPQPQFADIEVGDPTVDDNTLVVDLDTKSSSGGPTKPVIDAFSTWLNTYDALAPSTITYSSPSVVSNRIVVVDETSGGGSIPMAGFNAQMRLAHSEALPFSAIMTFKTPTVEQQFMRELSIFIVARPTIQGTHIEPGFRPGNASIQGPYAGAAGNFYVLGRSTYNGGPPGATPVKKSWESWCTWTPVITPHKINYKPGVLPGAEIKEYFVST